MRRSAREVRKPEVLTYTSTESQSSSGSRRKVLDPISDEENSDNDSEYSTRERETTIKQVKKNSGNVLKQKPSKESPDGGNSLLDAVVLNKSLPGAANDWVNRYKANKIQAMVVLVNFVLLAAGSKRSWVEEDVDLEALEPDELDLLLGDMLKAMSESEGSKMYPLIEKPKAKSSRSFRQKYQAFWTALVSKIRALPRAVSSSSSSATGGGRGRTVQSADVLRMVVEQLCTLSSMALVNIRDAVAEAALSVGASLLDCCRALKEELAVAQRQLAAEEAGRARSKSLASASAASANNPRQQALIKQKDAATKDMAELLDLTATIFNSVYVHRSKDFNHQVRATCIQHLPQYVLFDIKRPLRQEYLKYLGWACSDYEVSVRLAAVRGITQLLEEDAIVAHLRSFVEHFVGRFVELAACDVDDSVSIAMIGALRTMQQKGLLDTVSEEQLDLVDVIVFDPQASPRVRQEALAFLMDHTEGFEPVDDEDAEQAGRDQAGNSGKASKGGKKRGDKLDAAGSAYAEESKALARRQRCAVQLETLAEFAEHHLLGGGGQWVGSAGSGAEGLSEISGNLAYSSMLADACVGLRRFDIIYDWPTCVSLLLREGSGDRDGNEEDMEGGGEAALRPPLVAILIRIFVTTATQLNAKREHVAAHRSGSATAGAAACTAAAGTGALLHASEDFVLEHWEALNSCLQEHLAALLTHFQGDAANLAALVELLPCCEFESNSNSRALKALLKVVIGLVNISSDSKTLAVLVATLRNWMKLGGTAAGAVGPAVRSLASSTWSNVLDSSQQLQQLKDDAGKKSKASKRVSKASRQSRASQDDEAKEECLLGLGRALLKFKLFWANMDCRAILQDTDLEAVADELVEVSELLPAFVLAEGAELDPPLLEAATQAARNCLSVINSCMLWAYRDVIDAGKLLHRPGAAATAAGGAVEDDMDLDVDAQVEQQVESAIDAVLSIRDKFLDVLQTWIVLGADSSSTAAGSRASHDGTGSTSHSDTHSGSGSGSGSGIDAFADFSRSLRLEAFHMVSDVRSFFPARESQYRYIHRLAYQPSQELLGSMRSVFESEGERIKTKLEELTASAAEREVDGGSVTIDEAARNLRNEQEAKQLCSLLIDELLYPLSRNLVCDVEHLNRRQAAAVIFYLLDPNEEVQEAVKAIVRHLKEANIVKYLEIQIVALKQVFADYPLKALQQRLAAEEEEDEEFDLRANETAVEDGYVKLDKLAKRLSQSLGIAKFKEPALSSLVQFFTSTIDIALSDVSYVGFVSCLAHYTRFLGPPTVKALSQYLQQAVASRPEIAEELQAQQELGQPDVDFGRLIAFIEQMQGKRRSRMAHRKSGGTGTGIGVGVGAVGTRGLQDKTAGDIEADADVFGASLRIPEPYQSHQSAGGAAGVNARVARDRGSGAVSSVRQTYSGAAYRQKVATGAADKHGSGSRHNSNRKSGSKGRGTEKLIAQQKYGDDDEDEEEQEDSDEEGEEKEDGDDDEDEQEKLSGKKRSSSRRANSGSGSQQHNPARKTQKLDEGAQQQSRKSSGNDGRRSAATSTGAAQQQQQLQRIAMGLDIEEYDEDEGEEEDQDEEEESEDDFERLATDRGSSLIGRESRPRSSGSSNNSTAGTTSRRPTRSSGSNASAAAPSIASTGTVRGRSKRSLQSAQQKSVAEAMEEIDAIPSSRRRH